MKFYYKIAPVLMIIGFMVLAAGVFLSVSHKTAAFVLAGFGLSLYIIGRIGIYFSPKNTKNETIKSDGIEEETESKEN